jgi:hypothetical protein
MKISFAITVCNEFTEIQKLMDLLLRNKKIDDEIIILFDLNNGTQEVENYLKLQESLGNCKLTSDYFWDDFAEWKNKLNEVKKYIDEYNKRPSNTDKNKDVKSLGQWLSNQLTNTKNERLKIMKEDTIYNEWTLFIIDSKYKKYFQ